MKIEILTEFTEDGINDEKHSNRNYILYLFLAETTDWSVFPYVHLSFCYFIAFPGFYASANVSWLVFLVFFFLFHKSEYICTSCIRAQFCILSFILADIRSQYKCFQLVQQTSASVTRLLVAVVLWREGFLLYVSQLYSDIVHLHSLISFLFYLWLLL